MSVSVTDDVAARILSARQSGGKRRVATLSAHLIRRLPGSRLGTGIVDIHDDLTARSHPTEPTAFWDHKG
jgi:hypothetical protein